jgi:hypothetical protein
LSYPGRERSSAAALRQMAGKLADSPDLMRVADLATRAAVSAPTEGRALYAGLRALDVPEEPVARLWHAATLLREHRGDGHNAALLATASAAPRPTSCSLSPSACGRRSSAGSTTCPRRS